VEVPSNLEIYSIDELDVVKQSSKPLYATENRFVAERKAGAANRSEDRQNLRRMNEARPERSETGLFRFCGGRS
jgi:hypothetical protein